MKYSLTPSKIQRSKLKGFSKDSGYISLYFQTVSITKPALTFLGNQYWKSLFSVLLWQLGNTGKYGPVDWVNPSKRGGMDGVFQGLAGLLQGISQGAALPARGNPVHPDSLTWIYILFKIGHFGDISDFFSNIDVWRRMIATKFLEYVYLIIRIFLVLLWHFYEHKIKFY